MNEKSKRIFKNNEKRPQISRSSKKLISNNTTKYDSIICQNCCKVEAYRACIMCSKVYCKLCDYQIHIIKDNSNHKRSKIKEARHITNKCPNHQDVFKFYCETCNFPFCDQCKIDGKHSSKLHSISSITESFIKKFDILNTFISKELMTKYSKLLEYQKLIELTCEKVRNRRTSIEKDIKDEYTKLIERLKDEEGKKLSLLDHDAQVINQEIDVINELVNFVKEMDGNNPDILLFHQNYKLFREKADKSFAFELKNKIELNPEAFVNSLEETKKKIEKYDSLEKLVKTKDDIIWGLILEKNKNGFNENLQFYEKYKKELEKYKLTIFSLNEEIKKLRLSCYFCKKPNDEENINSECKKNLVNLHNLNKLKVDLENNFTGNHYFVKSNIKSSSSSENLKVENNFIKNRNLIQAKNKIIEKIDSPKIVSPNFNHEENLNINISFIGEVKILNLIVKMNEKAKKIYKNIYDIFSERFNEYDSVEVNELAEFLKKKFDFNEDELIYITKFFEKNFISFIDDGKKISLSKLFSYLRIKRLNVPNFSNEFIINICNKVKQRQINLYSLFSEYNKTYQGFILLDDLKSEFLKQDLIQESDQFDILVKEWSLDKKVYISDIINKLQ